MRGTNILLIMILVTSNFWLCIIFIYLHKGYSDLVTIKSVENSFKSFLERYNAEKAKVNAEAEKTDADDDQKNIKEWLSVREFSNIVGKNKGWVYYRYKKPGLMEYVSITDDGRILINKAAIDRVA